MTPEKCPACGAKLRREMLACPNCPMSFPEDDGPKDSGNPLKQSPLWKFVFPALFFGAIGATIWYLGTGLMRLGQANNQIESGNLFGDKPQAAVPPETAASPPADLDAAPRGSASAASGDDAPPTDDGGMVVISHLDENGTPIGDAAPEKAAARRRAPARSAPPPPKAPSEWKLRGSVYDLTTLKPLAGSALMFTDAKTNRSIMTRTDASGRYRVIVPPLNDGRGYDVAIERSGYAPNYLNPGIEDVREMAAAARRNLARGLSSTLAAAPATVSSAGAKPLVTDFYLAPRP